MAGEMKDYRPPQCLKHPGQGGLRARQQNGFIKL